MRGMLDYRVWAEIDLDALANNLHWIRHGVGEGCGVITVVKADAYGHGLSQIAGHLMQHGTDMLGVANLAEAAAVRSAGQGWPVLMLGGCYSRAEFTTLVRDQVSATVSSLTEVEELSDVARTESRTALVQVKIDTGMGRLGVMPAAAFEVVEVVDKSPNLELQGLYTHLSSSEDDPAYTCQQLATFESGVQRIQDAGIRIPMVHAMNSGGIACEAEVRGNFVRPGLLVYGLVPPGRRPVIADWLARLQPVLSLKTRISFVKSVPQGAAISYGQTEVCPRKRVLATVCAGYGDGIPRSAAGRLSVLIRGCVCRVVGVPTMDQMVVDVSSVESVERGDEVVVIGRQGERAISATDLAQQAGTIPWEILTSITQRVPRCYRGVSVS